MAFFSFYPPPSSAVGFRNLFFYSFNLLSLFCLFFLFFFSKCAAFPYGDCRGGSLFCKRRDPFPPLYFGQKLESEPPLFLSLFPPGEDRVFLLPVSGMGQRSIFFPSPRINPFPFDPFPSSTGSAPLPLPSLNRRMLRFLRARAVPLPSDRGSVF